MDVDRMMGFLPEIYRGGAGEDRLLRAFLAAADDMQSPVERTLDELAGRFDPRRCSDGFVPYLCSWLALDRYLDWPSGRVGDGQPRFVAGLGRLRETTAQAVRLARWRGTRDGLVRFLEVATGLSGFDVLEGTDAEGAPRAFHLHVRAPFEARRLADLVRNIFEAERPVHATFTLEFLAEPAPRPAADAPNGPKTPQTPETPDRPIHDQED